METVILVIHLLIAVAMVGVILIQKSEGGGLGIGGGTMGGMMTSRGSANLLTRATAILAAAFFTTSIVLAILAGTHGKPASIIDQMPAAPTAPAQPQAPAAPAEPAPPVAN
jgi:preprotein translocase subunit SecG